MTKCPYVGPADTKGLPVEVNTEANVSINDSRIQCEVLDMQKGVCHFSARGVHARQSECPVDDVAWSWLRLEIKLGDDSKGLGSSAKCLWE